MQPYETVKRVVDCILCLLALPIVVPVVSACALLIKLESPGPVLFVQQRTGRNGRRFRMFKLRTMCQDAERLKAGLRHLSHQTGPDFKIRQDPRITRVGGFLRKYSIDELPQILNVLKGDMSLVGPRPTSFDASTYALWHTERLEVSPGLTGMWQIHDRSNISFDERVRMDIRYIRRRSLTLDAWILLMTVRAVVLPRGAY